MTLLPGMTELREPIKPMRDMGSPGFQTVGGFITTKERNPLLIGEQRYVTASDILANISIVSAGLHYFLNLVASAEWNVEAVDDSAEAKQAAEFVESCMYDMETSWHRIIRRSGMYRFYGFGVHEWTAKRREDGRTGMARIESRPQFTIEQWDVDETGQVKGMWQRSPQDFATHYLPRGKVIYLVEDTFSDSPEGFGVFRHLADPASRFMEYQRIEGSGFERDFRGVPIGYAPRAEIMASNLSPEQKTQMLSGFENFVSMRAKSTNTALVLDSSTYQGQTEGGVTVTGNKKWGVELLTGSANGIEHIGTAIQRLNWDMAMILGVEGLLVGQSGGSRALSEDKSRNLYLNVNSCAKDIAEAYEKDFINPIWRLNGFDDRLKPTLKVEDVAYRSVTEIAQVVRDLATAGAVLAPDDPIINDVRDLLGVSRQPEGVTFVE